MALFTLRLVLLLSKFIYAHFILDTPIPPPRTSYSTNIETV
jgi:hypothetical protein